MKWLDEIIEANQKFKREIAIDSLPIQRQPGPYAIVTCMDPRINPAAAGLKPFAANGASDSQVRIIRTLGGICDDRSLLVGIHLAGFKEVALIMHTDCGLSLAHEKIDILIENMSAKLSSSQMAEFRREVGEPLRHKLRQWLYAFEDPKQAVIDEVARIRKYPFVPHSLIIHGLIYDLASGSLEIVHDGYGNEL